MPAAVPAIPVKPRSPAIRATTRNVIVHESIVTNGLVGVNSLVDSKTVFANSVPTPPLTGLRKAYPVLEDLVVQFAPL